MKYLIFLYSCLVFCQSTKIKVISSLDSLPISGVEIFLDTNNQKLITNEEGYFIFNFKNNTEVDFVKEGYIDKREIISNKTEIVVLTKIAPIQLKEIQLIYLSNNDLLDTIYKKINDNTLYETNFNYHFFNYLGANKDTLHYLNDRIKFIQNQGYYISKKSKIIRNFSNEEVKQKDLGTYQQIVYKYKNQDLVFFKNFIGFINSPKSFTGFNDLITNKEKYNIVFSKNDDYYIIEFNSKKKDRYYGKFIVDKLDFGIYELVINAEIKNFNVVNYNKSKPEKSEYLVLTENVYFKNFKQNDKYQLSFVNLDYKFKQIKGKYKGTIFTNSIKIEPTVEFKNENLTKFDVINFKVN
ncbi:hypothetical protein [Flavobacterium sp.]|uniref:hypothetical protein n=1 Tax=Flavobacterium sp. TaxID=239 RepID=UPI003F69DFE9